MKGTGNQEFLLCENIPDVIRDIDTFLENGYLNIHQLKTEWLYSYVIHAIKKTNFFSSNDSKLVLRSSFQCDLLAKELVSNWSDDQKVVLKVIVNHIHV